QIRIDNEQYVVSGVPEFVSVSLEGKTSTITPLVRQLNFDVFVDLEGLDEGEHTVEIQYENVPNDVSIYIEPKTIDVTIEEKASKEFSVTIDMLNTSEVPDGFELGTPVVEPSKVTITSSKSVIEQIAIVKVFVDVAGLKEPIKNREVPVNVYDGQGNELRANIEPENVVVSIPVINPSKTVPINISTAGSLPDDFTLKSLEAKIEESGTVKTDLVFPDGVVSSGDSEIEVNVEIEQTRTIEDIPIDIENGEEGQEVSFLEPANEVISLTVVGNEEDVSVLKPEDFQVLINIGGLEEGEHTVPITIEAPDEINVEADVDEVVIEL